VRQPHLILIIGLPGTGKSTLARSLARHLRVPLICKDTIKEPLLDLLGAPDRSESRRLSDASFAVMFALARDCFRAGTDVILEGNFRPGEHEAALSASIRDANPSVSNERNTSVLDAAIAPAFDRSASAASAPTANDAPHAVRITQILCRTPEPVRIARLKARATDPSRHAGHRDADLTGHLAADPPADLKVALGSGPATGCSPSASDFLAFPSERFVFDSDGDSTQLQALLKFLEQRNRDYPHV
jgi:predicted kinase